MYLDDTYKFTCFLSLHQDSDTPPPLIAGSVGPYGACEHDGSEYHGNYVDHMTKEVHVLHC